MDSFWIELRRKQIDSVLCGAYSNNLNQKQTIQSRLFIQRKLVRTKQAR